MMPGNKMPQSNSQSGNNVVSQITAKSASKSMSKKKTKKETKVSKKLESFYQKNKFKVREFPTMQSICSEIENTLSELQVFQNLPRHVDGPCLVKITGSAKDGFGMKESDLDLTLVQPLVADVGAVARQTEEEVIQKMKTPEENKKKNVLLHVKAETRCKVPFVFFLFKSQSGTGEIECDMSFNKETAVENAQLLHKYAEHDQRAPVIFAVIKNWAEKKKLYGTWSKHMNSFPWKLLVIHYLQKGCDPPILPVNDRHFATQSQAALKDLPWKKHKYANKSTAALLDGFFQFYLKFNFSKYRISVTSTSVPPSPRTPDPKEPIYIEDPSDENFNCARALSDSSFLSLMEHFKEGYMTARDLAISGK